MTTPVLFPTPQDAEAAFYEALERSDLDAMMNVWADEEEIYCIHPGGARLVGHAAIRETFRQIFTSGQRMQVQYAVQNQEITFDGYNLLIARVTPRGKAPCPNSE